MSEFLPSSAGVGNLRAGSGYRPTKQNHPARSPFTNCINVTAHLMVLCEFTLFATSCIAYLLRIILMKTRTVL